MPFPFFWVCVLYYTSMSWHCGRHAFHHHKNDLPKSHYGIREKKNKAVNDNAERGRECERQNKSSFCARPLVKLIYIIFACGALFIVSPFFLSLNHVFFATFSIVQQFVCVKQNIIAQMISHKFDSYFPFRCVFLLLFGLFTDIEKWGTKSPHNFYLLPSIYNLIHYFTAEAI